LKEIRNTKHVDKMEREKEKKGKQETGSKEHIIID